MYFDYKKQDQDLLEITGKEKPDSEGPELTRDKPASGGKKRSKKSSGSKLKFGTSKRHK